LRGCYSGKYNISGHVVNYLTNKWKFDILIITYPSYLEY
jgi:hypothetical protein